jgi:hypothetical protein
MHEEHARKGIRYIHDYNKIQNLGLMPKAH